MWIQGAAWEAADLALFLLSELGSALGKTLIVGFGVLRVLLFVVALAWLAYAIASHFLESV